MNGRLKIIGVMLAVIGLAFIAGGGFAFYKTNQGAQALQAFSAAQNVNLSYNEAGQLGRPRRDRRRRTRSCRSWSTTGATRSTAAELNPNDPLVNTASEYMYQMATIAYHTLHGTTTVVLDEAVTADDGTVYAAGTYEFATDGRYWTGFDRTRTRSKARPATRSGPARPMR